jgi:hypothetical protein
MTIIFNLCSFGITLLCFYASYHFRRVFYRSKHEVLKNYSNAFISTGLGFLMLFLPGFIIFNPTFVQITFISLDIFFLIAVLFFIPSTLSLFKKTSRFKKTAFLIIFSWTLVYIILNIFFFSPATPLKTNSHIYYWQGGTSWFQAITRGLLFLALLIIALFFLFGARLPEEKALSKKSFLLGLSNLMIDTAWFIFCFFPFFYFSPKLLIFSGLLAFSGFILEAITTLFLFKTS